jgi:hypothetical protein
MNTTRGHLTRVASKLELVRIRRYTVSHEGRLIEEGIAWQGIVDWEDYGNRYFLPKSRNRETLWELYKAIFGRDSTPYFSIQRVGQPERFIYCPEWSDQPDGSWFGFSPLLVGDMEARQAERIEAREREMYPR